jgi:23S rRNA pseudouridine1911/1915/1917 synthase
MTDRVVSFSVAAGESLRLDKYLVQCLPEFSRSRIQGLIRDGFIMVNGIPVMKTGMVIEGGNQVEVHIPPPEPSGIIAEEIPLDILFENKDLLVINKPAGMVVHPAAGHADGTLVNAALAHLPDLEGIGGEQRPGVVHRLDKETSGLILLAKNDRSLQWLQNQFKTRRVKKVYFALVDGHPPTPQGRIEAAIGRDPSHRKQMAIVPDSRGREAVTEYFTVESFPLHTYLEVHPFTGRTHQIRLHLEFIGCPIVGDILYGHRKHTLEINRHFLHAARLTIRLPGESRERTFEAPLPAELVKILEFLRRD